VEEDTESTDDQHFLMSAQLSPTYSYRDASNRYFNQFESGKLGISGGLQMGIKTNKRLSIHTGLMYAQLGYNIDQVNKLNVTVDNPANVFGDSETYYAVNNSIGTWNSTEDKNGIISTNTENLSDEAATIRNNQSLEPAGQIEQYFRYLEVPFLLRYKIIDQKMDINLIGGLSTDILLGNNSSLKSGNSVHELGPSANIKSMNYLGNIGLGVDYNLRRNVIFTMEPQFKYFLNSINQSGLISNRPYMFGMFTGIRVMW
jgi:hypothetical protein